MKKELSTPAAILIGSGIIAAGLYFGLQRSPLPAPAAAASDPDGDRSGADGAAQGGRADEGLGVASTAGAPRPAARAPEAAVPDEIYAQVKASAAKALEAKRAEFVQRCWEPSAKRSPDPPRAKYIFNMSFDESGREIARGISEVRGMARPDAAQCLRMLPLGLEVPATGARVLVDVEMFLP